MYPSVEAMMVEAFLKLASNSSVRSGITFKMATSNIIRTILSHAAIS
jgi:hypothetical protein